MNWSGSPEKIVSSLRETLFSCSRNIVWSRQAIIDKLWRDDEVPFDRVIDVYVKNLRKKLHLDCIITVKGVGYRYEEP